MQSEELEEGPLEASSSKTDMTFSDSATDSSSPKAKVQETIDEFKFQDIDQSEKLLFETDIENMVPESPLSSELAEVELKSEEVTKQSAADDNETENLKALQDQSSNESIRSWLQRITQMQTEIQRKLNLEKCPPPIHPFSEFPAKPNNATNQIAQTSSRVVKYQDLPYMGEMTLDNSKPRRGRKPKKADICHLIYKNYGTIYPGTPNPKSLVDRELNKKNANVDNKLRESPLPDSFNRSDVQNRIISSLLEKRLTQESKRHKNSLLASSKRPQTVREQDQNEPLNLCIRDLNQLKIRLLRKHDNVYTSDIAADVKSEPQSDDDVEFIHETPSPSSSQPKEAKNVAALDGSVLTGEVCKTPENGVAPGGYVYWPNAGVFIHPMALQQQLMYYQKLAANNSYTLPSPRPLPDPVPETHPSELRKLAPKIKPRKQDTSEDTDHQNTPEHKTKRNAPSCSEKTPTKRKRSAIFIPPIPAENQTNPATEVSICKFKFTGGAKPSLQEKKMLSVDSGGNFRYYSGTGDKSMRGYEFFPRETLQQQIGNTQGSSTGAFLQASGEKIFPSSPTDFPGKPPHDFMLTPEIQPPTLSAIPDMGPRHKKRKSRKSLQREKLEQTFKEKGFLIQTQQLESAEGATYCKFRQLRKFTRYLFRSWKDYLPGISAEGQEDKVNEHEEITEADIENLSTLSNSELNSSDLQSTT